DQGARFELHFEKARGLHGEAVAPFEARLVTDGTGLARFEWGPLAATDFDRAVPLFQTGASVREAAALLSLSKSACHRLRTQAVERGLV
ncbi:MAG: RNA polymerase subunit sigma-70, partial [Proteobacteria bacterium]|nr:RNA polymerase subunit sigma-70 [Pseudomonadota bacterium]